MPVHPIRLLDLSDDVLTLIISHLLSPIPVHASHRLSAHSLISALPFARCNRRLLSLFSVSLVDLELWSPSLSSAPSLRFLCHLATTHIRRLILRGCPLPAAAFAPLASHCTALHTLDLSFAPAVNDTLLSALCPRVSPPLRSLLLRRCTAITDIGLATVADHCHRLSALDIAGLHRLTDRAIRGLCDTQRHSLTILVLSWCTRLTDASLTALATTQIQALFLRGLPITDRGVDAFAKAIGPQLSTIDLLDCPHLTNTVFDTSLREYCPRLRDRLELAHTRDFFQNSVSILFGYIHIVAGVSPSGSRSTLVCIVDAGSANAFAFQVLSGNAINFESNDVKVLAANSGLAVSIETRRVVKERFGIEV